MTAHAFSEPHTVLPTYGCELVSAYRARTTAVLAESWAESTTGSNTTLTLRSLALPTEWSQICTDRGGGGVLWSASWAVVPHLLGPGWAETPSLAQLRFCGIASKNATIVNTMIFPARPETLPVFVAEILEFGQTPRLAFVDLQGPGLDEPVRQSLCERTEPLLTESLLTESLLTDSFPTEPPPSANAEADAKLAWALEAAIHPAQRPAGTMGRPILFARPWSVSAREPIREIYERVLRVWADLALQVARRSSTQACPTAAAALARYIYQHRTYAPVQPFLARLFGADWAERFVRDYLYA